MADPKDEKKQPSGGSEHRKNARPSTREKHEKARGVVAKSRGGEKADGGRDDNRKPPRNWKGPWPPVTGGRSLIPMSNEVVIQVSSRFAPVFLVAESVRRWSEDSKIVLQSRLEVGHADNWAYCNVHLRVSDLRTFQVLFTPIRQNCVRQLAAYRRRYGPGGKGLESSFIVLAQVGDTWDEYEELYNYPKAGSDESA